MTLQKCFFCCFFSSQFFHDVKLWEKVFLGPLCIMWILQLSSLVTRSSWLQSLELGGLVLFHEARRVASPKTNTFFFCWKPKITLSSGWSTKWAGVVMWGSWTSAQSNPFTGPGLASCPPWFRCFSCSGTPDSNEWAVIRLRQSLMNYELIVWIRCAGACKHLKHVGQEATRNRIFKKQ